MQHMRDYRVIVQHCAHSQQSHIVHLKFQEAISHGKCLLHNTNYIKKKKKTAQSHLLEWPKSKILPPPNAGVRNSKIAQVNPMNFTKVVINNKSVMCTSEKTVHEEGTLKPKYGMRLRGILLESS